jgi:cell pole-organizing protein PopZ
MLPPALPEEPVLAAPEPEPEPEPAPAPRGKAAKAKRAAMAEDDSPETSPPTPLSMMIMVGPDTTPLAPKFVEPPAAPLLPEPTSMVIMVGPHETPAPPLTMEPAPMPAAAPTESSILDDQMTSALSSSIGSAMRGATTERSTSIGRAGITLEDIVREEMKPVLKAWLETNLPEMVERVVRAEIERVVARLKG